MLEGSRPDHKGVTWIEDEDYSCFRTVVSYRGRTLPQYFFGPSPVFCIPNPNSGAAVLRLRIAYKLADLDDILGHLNTLSDLIESTQVLPETFDTFGFVNIAGETFVTHTGLDNLITYLRDEEGEGDPCWLIFDRFLEFLQGEACNWISYRHMSWIAKPSKQFEIADTESEGETDVARAPSVAAVATPGDQSQYVPNRGHRSIGSPNIYDMIDASLLEAPSGVASVANPPSPPSPSKDPKSTVCKTRRQTKKPCKLTIKTKRKVPARKAAAAAKSRIESQTRDGGVARSTSMRPSRAGQLPSASVSASPTASASKSKLKSSELLVSMDHVLADMTKLRGFRSTLAVMAMLVYWLNNDFITSEQFKYLMDAHLEAARIARGVNR